MTSTIEVKMIDGLHVVRPVEFMLSSVTSLLFAASPSPSQLGAILRVLFASSYGVSWDE
jgi:hypothetical protein